MQHRIWERRRDLVDWLDSGAYFYVCGDAKAMAKDVRATLVRAYADVKALAPEAAEQAVRDARARASAICRTCIDGTTVVPAQAETAYAVYHRCGTAAESFQPRWLWVPACAGTTATSIRTNGRRTLAQRAHQGSERLPARHAGRRAARGDHRRDRRGRPAAREIPRHVPAGRPRPARRAPAQEDGEGLRLHDPRAHPRRRADAGAMARARPRSRATTATARCGSPRGRPSSSTASSSRTSSATMAGDRRARCSTPSRPAATSTAT